MEKINRYQKAIDVLEIVRSDCLKWIEARGALEGNEAKRNRILGKTVGIGVKLGELYANEYIADPEAAERNLIEAVETALKEQKRRDDEGVKEGEGPWMNNEEMGGALECKRFPHITSVINPISPNATRTQALADHYEAKNQHYLAAPLYLQALTLLPTTNCHAVVLSK
ncbi:MAG: hypothetical protein Q9187_007796, partial [Circinaria calcarea]